MTNVKSLSGFDQEVISAHVGQFCPKAIPLITSRKVARIDRHRQRVSEEAPSNLGDRGKFSQDTNAERDFSSREKERRTALYIQNVQAVCLKYISRGRSRPRCGIAAAEAALFPLFFFSSFFRRYYRAARIHVMVPIQLDKMAGKYGLLRDGI